MGDNAASPLCFKCKYQHSGAGLRSAVPGGQRSAAPAGSAPPPREPWRGRHGQFGRWRRQNKSMTINNNQHRFVTADWSFSPRGWNTTFISKRQTRDPVATGPFTLSQPAGLGHWSVRPSCLRTGEGPGADRSGPACTSLGCGMGPAGLPGAPAGQRAQAGCEGALPAADGRLARPVLCGEAADRQRNSF